MEVKVHLIPPILLISTGTSWSPVRMFRQDRNSNTEAVRDGGVV